MIASISGIFSLFPLLFTPSGEPFWFLVELYQWSYSGTETLVKTVYSLIWGVMVLYPLHKQVYE